MALTFKDWCKEAGADPATQSAQAKYDTYINKQNTPIDKLNDSGELGQPLHD